MADFAADVSRWCDGRRRDADAALRAIAMGLVNRVKELTPVDTGFLRSNWAALRQGDPEPVAGRVSPPDVALVEAHVGDVIVIINPTIYARRIEYGFVGEDSQGRHYNQQGAHMMQQTMAELPQIAARAVARVRGG